ncbi:hypothetical protein AA906_13455 [Geobacillus stearothermophilus]|nr:hypothetical protein AA906_13455 [Geobacillus stearothermophilus]
MIFNTVVNDVTASLVDIIIHFIIAIHSKQSLFTSGAFDFLLIFYALKSGIFFVKPLIDTF